MSKYRETVYRGRDNRIEFALESGDGELFDASGITKCELVFKQDGVSDIKVNSQSSPALFDFTQKVYVRGQRIGVITFKLGGISSGTLPDGLYEMEVYLFDAVNTAGVYWDTLSVHMRDGETA